ncbi:hypothetical protein LSH36_226g00003 [Paralvinella palmiformis]|uniref:Dynein axonemal intermediate chain 4 n=1 Tax=Paralvinella palmiformis TaxID=53620 RepID=A0AAD9JNE2_9ANNE|nr:hypothetical protein LSH36_226g00003 [Paralvinella palmiformis]
MPQTSSDSQSRVRKSMFGGTSRTLLSSAGKRGAQLPGEKVGVPGRPPITITFMETVYHKVAFQANTNNLFHHLRDELEVVDENGQDVTPLPLSQIDTNALRKNQANVVGESSAATPTDLMSQASIYQQGTVTASTFGGGPFTRSVFSVSQSERSTGSMTEDFGEPGSENLSTGWTETRVQYKREEVIEDLMEEDLEKTVDIDLTETETIWLLDMPGVCVSLESEEAAAIREQNARYSELVKSRLGNDRYMERGMNTFNEPPKYKNIQTSKISYNDVGVNASTWDMYDTYQIVKQLENKDKEESEEEDSTVSRPVSTGDEKQDQTKEDVESGSGEAGAKEVTTVSLHKSVVESQNMSTVTGTDSVFASRDSGVAAVSNQKQVAEVDILKSEALKKNLVIMERVVNLNTYQPKQAQYRGYDIITDTSDKDTGDTTEQEQQSLVSRKKKEAPAVAITDMGPNLDRLWAYQAPISKGRNVSCIAWNKVNSYPERCYTTPAGVTALDFSKAHPNLLSVGLYDGTVAIYNVRRTENETVLDSLKDMRTADEDHESSGKHTGPVWQLRWIEKERGSGEERMEVLVSISTDGRVTQWSIRKGFESSDLMKLKRIPSKIASNRIKKTEAFISRFSGGLCFDFSSKDSNIYLAGTEEGHIHRCSCSYNEQYLDSYFGHAGPVYKIQWSPFNPDVFLSCSSDWSIRLWHQDRLQPILSFHSSTKAVPDVCWSPRISTVFACVNEGAVEVWDLSQSTLDPLIVTTPVQGIKLSTITFAKNSECLLVGDNEGQVTVYDLRCMPAVDDKNGKALQKIIQASIANQLASK